MARDSSKSQKPVILPPLEPTRRYTIDQAKAFLNISHSFIYKKIARGELRTIKDGRRTYVPGAEIIKASTLEAAA